MSNPLEIYALDGLSFVTQMAVDIGISPQKYILDAIERYYPKRYLKADLDSGRALF